MADTKISALTSGNPAQGSDVIPIDRAGANFSITAASIAKLAGVPSQPNALVKADSDGTFSASNATDDGSTFALNSNFINLLAQITYKLATAAVPVFANNAGAIGGGLVAGNLYRTGADPDQLCIVH